MLQSIVVILIVAASATWLGLQAYRFIRRKPSNKFCGGTCCSPSDAAPPPSGPRTQMISSDDLRARLSARRT